jgi:hypothetical protein
MTGDDLCAVSWRAGPRSFVSLMTLYESNYIRLGWLVSDLRRQRGSLISHVDTDCDLRLRIEEQSPYTSRLVLTYVFGDGLLEIEDPGLEICVYHDARVAEACSLGPVHGDAGLRALRHQLARGLDQRWARNVMLNKWLEYCADRGHRFAPAS